jgi:hypothetical protein
MNPTQMCVNCGYGWPDYLTMIQFSNNPFPAMISNAGGVSGVTAGSATLNGCLDSIGSDTPTISVYWGTTDRGTNTAGWDHIASIGTPSGLPVAAGSVSVGLTDSNYFGETFTTMGAGVTGQLSTTVSGLNPGTTYYYRFYALNSAGQAWGDPAVQFKSAS